MKVNYDNGHFTEEKLVTFKNFAGQFDSCFGRPATKSSSQWNRRPALPYKARAGRESARKYRYGQARLRAGEGSAESLTDMVRPARFERADV